MRSHGDPAAGAQLCLEFIDPGAAQDFSVVTPREWPWECRLRAGGGGGGGCGGGDAGGGGIPAPLLGRWLVLKSGSLASSSNRQEALRLAAPGIWEYGSA